MARPTNPKTLRLKLGMNQTKFWSQVFVTQSGGSRYESGRPMPPPVKALVGHVYEGRPVKVHQP